MDPGATSVRKSRKRSAAPQVSSDSTASRRPGPSKPSKTQERVPESSTEDDGQTVEVHEDEWEEEGDDDEKGREQERVASSRASSSVPSTPKSTRRKRVPAKSRAVVTTARSPRAQQAYTSGRASIAPTYTPPQVEYHPPAPAHKPSRVRDSAATESSWQEAPRHIGSSLKAAIIYALDVLKPAVQLMKYPLILITFLLILATVLNSVAGIFRSAFAPFCYIPGVSHMGACQWINHPGHSTKTGKEVQRADYPALIDLEAKTFDQLVDESMGVAGSLSLNLKKTEVACKDLISLVKLSELASKDILAETLVEFTSDARVTAEGLNRLAAKFNGALDNIMAVNDYALNSVAKARKAEPTTLGGRVNAMMPWSPPRKDVNLVVVETFKTAMDMLSMQLERLIVFAETSYKDLTKLEETLTTLHEIVQRENDTVAIDKDELLQQLWTKLGGNRKELRSYNRHLTLLKELASYKKQAQAHVVAALHTLQGMSQEMDDIRERVAAPDLSTPHIAPEVHMKSIQLGLERLKESRIRARELDHEAMRKILAESDHY